MVPHRRPWITASSSAQEVFYYFYSLFYWINVSVLTRVEQLCARGLRRLIKGEEAKSRAEEKGGTAIKFDQLKRCHCHGNTSNDPFLLCQRGARAAFRCTCGTFGWP